MTAGITVRRRSHEFPLSATPGRVVKYVRWHVVGDDGKCIPALCVTHPHRATCGYPRRRQAWDVVRAERVSVALPW